MYKIGFYYLDYIYMYRYWFFLTLFNIGTVHLWQLLEVIGKKNKTFKVLKESVWKMQTIIDFGIMEANLRELSGVIFNTGICLNIQMFKTLEEIGRMRKKGARISWKDAVFPAYTWQASFRVIRDFLTCLQNLLSEPLKTCETEFYILFFSEVNLSLFSTWLETW